jgi:hypothetical protein
LFRSDLKEGSSTDYTPSLITEERQQANSLRMLSDIKRYLDREMSHPVIDTNCKSDIPGQL